MSHSLNDIARFWSAVSNSPDLIDDPQGFRHPLLEKAATLGISPNELCEFCRHVQETRAKQNDKPRQIMAQPLKGVES